MSEMKGYVILAVNNDTNKVCLYGSPAKKNCDDLDAEDEILQVNGKNLSDCGYVEVLKHIHNCIQSKKITLGVRRPKNKLDASFDHIPPGKRAIALAIEKDATERLIRLSQAKRVKQIDIERIPSKITDVISSPIYVANFPKTTNTAGGSVPNGSCSSELIENPTESSKQPPEASQSHKGKLRIDLPHKDTNMTSAVMQRNGNSGYYVNGHINTDEPNEMAVDCPPSFMATHPANSNFSTPRLETPPPTPLDSQAVQNQKNKVEKDLQAAATYAESLPQPEMDLSRIHRMRESMKRQRELRKRDQQVREDMTKEENAEKLRKIKSMTPDEAALSRKKGVENLGYELESASDEEEDEEELSNEGSALNFENIFATLNEIAREVDDPALKSDLGFVRSFVQQESFQEAVLLQNTITKHTTSKAITFVPVQREVETLIEEVDDDLSLSKESSARELSALLSKHHMKGLIEAHDGVAQHANVSKPHPSSSVTSPEDSGLLQRASKYTTKPAKIVTVNKSGNPLGATVKVEEDGSVIVSRLVVGGAAEKSHLLHEGDEILEVNGQSMQGKDVNEVGDAIGAMTGILKFLIVPVTPVSNGQISQIEHTNKEPVMHVRALFDYDAYDDPYLPCREIGLSFQKGDILHIMTKDDENWWQAYREGDQDHLTLPGLIPSQNFQHQIETIRISNEKREEAPETRKGLLCGKKGVKKKKKRKKENSSDSVSESGDEIEIYEEMALYYQPESKKRPIVLIGPPNVGRHELRQRLVENDRDRFSFAVPHTTRPRNDGELDGQDYHFVSVKEFEMMIAQNRFLEHGSFQKNLYGTTIDTIQRVIDFGSICVINLHAESLRRLKSTSLKPYVIFVAPPSLERLRQNVSKEGKQIKEDELRNIIERARVIEQNYVQYFDETIRNTDLSRSYAELLRLINKLDTEPQWVPAAWLD